MPGFLGCLDFPTFLNLARQCRLVRQAEATDASICKPVARVGRFHRRTLTQSPTCGGACGVGRRVLAHDTPSSAPYARCSTAPVLRHRRALMTRCNCLRSGGPKQARSISGSAPDRPPAGGHGRLWPLSHSRPILRFLDNFVLRDESEHSSSTIALQVLSLLPMLGVCHPNPRPS